MRDGGRAKPAPELVCGEMCFGRNGVIGHQRAELIKQIGQPGPPDEPSLCEYPTLCVGTSHSGRRRERLVVHNVSDDLAVRTRLKPEDTRLKRLADRADNSCGSEGE